MTTTTTTTADPTPSQRRAAALAAWQAAIADPATTTPAQVADALLAAPKSAEVLSDAFGATMAALTADPSAFTDPTALAAMGAASALRTAVEAAIAAKRPPRATQAAADPRVAQVDKARRALLRLTQRGIEYLAEVHAVTTALASELPADVIADAQAAVDAMTTAATTDEAAFTALMARPTRAAAGSGKSSLVVTDLTAGTVLQHGEHRCTFQAADQWQVNGVTYKSATAAAQACNGGGSVNGLAYWRTVPTA